MSERSVRHRSRERNRSSRKSRDWSRSRSWRSKDSTPGRGTRQRRSSACRKGRNLNVLRRTVSEPVLSQAGLHWEDEDLEINGKAKKKDKCLMRPHTLMDIFDRSYTSPSLPPRTPLFQKTEKPFAECDRFLVSVTVEGSTGPIKLIVKKADTVSDLIKLTIQNYAKEGRHPVLDSDANMFELHLSNFSMESTHRSALLLLTFTLLLSGSVHLTSKTASLNLCYVHLNSKITPLNLCHPTFEVNIFFQKLAYLSLVDVKAEGINRCFSTLLFSLQKL